LFKLSAQGKGQLTSAQGG